MEKECKKSIEYYKEQERNEFFQQNKYNQNNPLKNEIEILSIDKITIQNEDIFKEINPLRKVSKSNEKKQSNKNNIYDMDSSNEEDNKFDNESDQDNNSDFIEENNLKRIYYNTFNQDLINIQEEHEEENFENPNNISQSTNNSKRTDFLENFNPNDKSNDFRVKRNQTVLTIKEGILKKKSPWFHYNTRKVILDSSPRIEYIDPVINKVKGSIYLTKFCEAIYKKHYIFELKTQKRTFKFKTDDFEAGIWCRVINETIQKYSRN